MERIHVTNQAILDLGRQGENLARALVFDVSEWRAEYGEGTVQLLNQRSRDTAPYPAAIEQEGDQVIWPLTSTDTACAGGGKMQLLYFVGDVLAKQYTCLTNVVASLGQPGEVPEAQKAWVERVLAEAAKVTGMKARAVELPAGAEPTAEYADGVLTIGIPLGGDVSEAQIAQAVADYLAENPIEETDPTVPAWAKQPEKPSYTADEVGALSATTHIPSTAADVNAEPSGAVAQHNVSDAAHSDIRLLIQGLTDRLNALADSDDTTLDQLSEVVAYIKRNRSLIEAITTSKVSVADIVDDLTTNVSNKPLSAAQGVALKALINAIEVPSDDHINSLIDTKLGVIENGAY